jgi:simple sugar transport system ATP-binding protein
MPAEHVGKAESPSAAPRPAAIELRGIDKSFGPVHANKNVNLSIAKGSIHGIIGENGAGKSTLMSILYGFYTADSGEILINGNPVRITARMTRSPRASAWCISISCWWSRSPCWRT